MIDYRQLFVDCKSEIEMLRRIGEIQEAKLEMVYIMREFLIAKPGTHAMIGMGEKIERRIDEAIQELTKALQDAEDALKRVDKKETTPNVNIGGVGGSNHREVEDRFS